MPFSLRICCSAIVRRLIGGRLLFGKGVYVGVGSDGGKFERCGGRIATGKLFC